MYICNLPTTLPVCPGHISCLGERGGKIKDSQLLIWNLPGGRGKEETFSLIHFSTLPVEQVQHLKGHDDYTGTGYTNGNMLSGIDILQ